MRPGAILWLFVALTACGGDAPQSRRSVDAFPAAATETIDWSRSVGIFIGVETFRAPVDAPPDVRFAADDATRLAWMFTRELPSPLRTDRTLLLLSGTPVSEESRAHLAALRKDGIGVVERFDADEVYTRVRDFAANVGENGVLVLAIATHGMTAGGAHVLLTPDATRSEPKGVVLNHVLAAIPQGRGDRVLLFVDACREPVGSAPERMFEDLRFPGRYAIFAASAPGGYARADEARGNGYFTAAVADALTGGAKMDATGYVTPVTIAAFVSEAVRNRTRDAQRPEARFGGLEDLQLLRPRPVTEIGRIVEPLARARVEPDATVALLVFRPDLYATVFVCAASTGRCWKQNAHPLAAPPNAITEIGVQYGGADSFRIHVALTADSDFLRGEADFPRVPADRRARSVVYWLNPVAVRLEEDS
jgi:hypothetical protein